MTPPLLLGVLASQIQGHLSSFEPIQTQVVSGATAPITFNPIPQTYKHLQLVICAKPSAADARLNFNGDSTDANYNSHGMWGDGTGNGSQNYAIPYIDSGGTDNTYPMAIVIDILDYTSANKFKSARILSGWDKNGLGRVGLFSVDWRNTAPITRIDLTGRTWDNGIIALYGSKG